MGGMRQGGGWSYKKPVQRELAEGGTVRNNITRAPCKTAKGTIGGYQLEAKETN